VVRGSAKGDCECGPGCTNCYVKAFDNRFHFLPERTMWYPDKLKKLATMRFPEFSPKRGAPHRPMCFVADTGDLFHEDVPDLFLMHVFDVLRGRPNVIWQILTKRPRRMGDIITRYCRDRANIARLRDSIWLGVSISNQRTADERIPILLDIPPAARWVSIEPMLSAMDILHYLDGCPEPCGGGHLGYVSHDMAIDAECPEWEGASLGYQEPEWVQTAPCLDWVVLGAESGSNRRPFKVEWAADIKQQCDAAGVAFFGKQDSGLHPGKPLLVDGREWKEWPKI